MTAAHFLLVEDDDLVGELLEFILQREGYEVTWVRDGQAAVEALDGDSHFRAAILDVMVPHVDGLQLLEKIRACEDRQSLPILMLTAKSQSQDVALALEMGADDYLVKPFQPAELTARLKRLLR